MNEFQYKGKEIRQEFFQTALMRASPVCILKTVVFPVSGLTISCLITVHLSDVPFPGAASVHLNSASVPYSIVSSGCAACFRQYLIIAN